MMDGRGAAAVDDEACIVGWERNSATDTLAAVSTKRRLYDRFGNEVAGDAPHFDCPRDGELAFEQQAPQTDVSIEEDTNGGDLRISGRVERDRPS